METIGELIITGAMASFLFVGLHYFPWRQIVGSRRSAILDPPYNYVCGVLGLGAIYSGLIVNWWLAGKVLMPWMALAAFWVVVAGGGGAVLFCYILDTHLEKLACAKDEQARAELSARRQQDAEQ
jgi:hypothetical protein